MRLTCPDCGAQYEVPEELIPKSGRDVQCSNCGNAWFQPHPDHPEMAEDLTDQTDEQDWAGVAEPSQRKGLDQKVADVLREEAEREKQARAAEAQSGLETQPDLGLREADTLESRFLTPETEPSTASTDLPAQTETRAAGPKATPSTQDLEQEAPAGSINTGTTGSGFGRGFRLAVILVAIAATPYLFASQIYEMVPELKEPLTNYVAFIDEWRAALHDQFGELANQIKTKIGA